jgi:hypothetical protein
MVEHNRVEVVAFFRSSNTALGQRVFFLSSFLLMWCGGTGWVSGPDCLYRSRSTVTLPSLVNWLSRVPPSPHLAPRSSKPPPK